MTNALKVLIIDDEEEICLIFKKWLSAEGHEVEYALTGKQAINLVKKHRFDYVFLDIIMPGIPAIEVFVRIKTISPQTKIVIITGQLTDNILKKELKQKGAYDYLLKPFKMDYVMDILKVEDKTLATCEI